MSTDFKVQEKDCFQSTEGASGDHHLQIVLGIAGLLLKPGSSNGLPAKPYQLSLFTVGIKQQPVVLQAFKQQVVWTCSLITSISFPEGQSAVV